MPKLLSFVVEISSCYNTDPRIHVKLRHWSQISVCFQYHRSSLQWITNKIADLLTVVCLNLSFCGVSLKYQNKQKQLEYSQPIFP